MNKVLIVLFLLGGVTSCRESNDSINSDIIGQWKLIEVLADPGDGSGTFQSVTSEKIIEFKPDGTVKSNGSICILSIDSSCPSSGQFSLSDSTLTSSDCANTPPIKIKFRQKGSILTISYSCDEACIAKFIKK